MDWKELLKQMLTILASALFTWLIGKYPNFPLDKENFVNFLLWLFSLTGLIGGLRFTFFRLSLAVKGQKFSTYFEN